MTIALALETAGFPLIYLYNLVAGRFGRQRESWLRTFYRVLHTMLIASSLTEFTARSAFHRQS